MKSKWTELVPYAIAGAAVLAVMLMVVWFFMRIPIEGTTLALDWISIRAGLVNWDLTYSIENGLRYPPWSALLLLPLGQIPMGAGWGVVASLTLMVLPLCLPRETESGKARILAILALTLSYPAVRTIVDGNIEFLILTGLVLVEYGLIRKKPIVLGLGVLLAATKVQETWILIIFLPILAEKEWFPRKWLAAFGIMAAIGLPTMLWRGRAWLLSIITSPYRGSIMDSSLLTTVQRLGGPPMPAYLLWAVVLGLTVFLSLRYIRGSSREAFGVLTAVSLLLSPYAAGNNVLIVYAIAVIPLLLARRWEGVLLAVLCNLPYLLLPFPDLNYRFSASYWTLVLGLTWVLLALRLRGIHNKSNLALGAAKP